MSRSLERVGEPPEQCVVKVAVERPRTGVAVNHHTAKALLADERLRVRVLLQHLEHDRLAESESADAQSDRNDSAEQQNDDVADCLRQRVLDIDAAEARLVAGTYGLSVRRGRTIPDERLRADPAAELTVEEAAQD